MIKTKHVLVSLFPPTSEYKQAMPEHLKHCSPEGDAFTLTVDAVHRASQFLHLIFFNMA